MCWKMCQSRLETRAPPPPRDTCATSYSQIQSRRKFKQLAWTCIHSRMQKNTCTHTHKHRHICLFERQGWRVSLFQQMATMPWAKSKYGQQTDNCCQSRERWDARGPNLLPPSILSKWEARLMKMEENCIHLIPYILWQYCVGMCPQPATAKQSSIH